MSKSLKIAIYAVLVLCAVWMARAFYTNYAGDSAVPANEAPGTNAPAVKGDAPVPEHAGTFQGKRASRLVTYALLFLAFTIGAGLMAAHDVSHFFGSRVEAFIFNDEGPPVESPEYDHAEEVWKAGKHLEAIQLMRDYLKEHPREQYVALRIAEIYEKDLSNFVAATLEYEEILKKRLPPERWGWAAIHLANLYSGKLNRVADAEALLHRIVNEYGQTAAAKKARQRLGLPEPVAPPPPEPPEKTEPAADPPPSPPPASNLPPGFRPKSG